MSDLGEAFAAFGKALDELLVEVPLGRQGAVDAAYWTLVPLVARAVERNASCDALAQGAQGAATYDEDGSPRSWSQRALAAEAKLAAVEARLRALESGHARERDYAFPDKAHLGYDGRWFTEERTPAGYGPWGPVVYYRADVVHRLEAQIGVANADVERSHERLTEMQGEVARLAAIEAAARLLLAAYEAACRRGREIPELTVVVATLGAALGRDTVREG